MKKLPIGIQNFEKLISRGDLYVDKTALIYTLLSTGSTYFLSRPRRFGKSLLISTLDAVFQGKKNLFNHLAIAKTDWQWQQHPVIRIDFSRFSLDTPESLIYGLKTTLHKIAASYQVVLTEERDLKLLFEELIIALSQQAPVVVLIDEYDKPIINHLGNNIDIAKQNREILKGFYEVIKASDEYLKFVFLTGISKFSQMSVFSGLNNLNDISMNPEFTTLLGCTEQEIDDNFSDYVQQLANSQQLTVAETREKMRHWYNGFRFSDADTTVYTPYSLLLLFKNNKFTNYWFSTATPNFLINLIRNKRYDLHNIEAKAIGRMTFANYEVDRLRVLPLLVQTGYLTIAHYHRDADNYDLAYPNFEVAESFNQCLMEMLTEIPPEENETHISRCVSALNTYQLEDFFHHLHIFFAEIPYQIHLKYEAYYQSVFYVLFKLIGLKIHAEIQTNVGRVDAVIETTERIYVIEFKFDGTADQALQQILDKKYYEKYMGSGKTVVLVGVNFSRDKRNIDGYKAKVI